MKINGIIVYFDCVILIYPFSNLILNFISFSILSFDFKVEKLTTTNAEKITHAIAIAIFFF